MELFFLWLWLSLPTIFWVGLLALIVGSVANVVFFLKWWDKSHILDFDNWYSECHYHIHNMEERKKTYEKYLSGKQPCPPNPYKKWMRGLLVTLFCWLLFIPSQKDVAILVGASYALDAAKSPEAAKVTSILRAKVNGYLDAEIKAINQEKKP